MPQHGGAADDDQGLHEEHVQPCAEARYQPGGDGAAGNAREADHHAGENACASRRSKRWNSAALQRSSDDADERIGREHRGPARPLPSSSETRITPVPVATPLGEAEDARADAPARCGRATALLRRGSRGAADRGDHGDAEDGADSSVHRARCRARCRSTRNGSAETSTTPRVRALEAVRGRTRSARR